MSVASTCTSTSVSSIVSFLSICVFMFILLCNTGVNNVV